MKTRGGRVALRGAAFVAFLLALDLAAGSLAPVAPQRSFRMAHPYYHHGLRPLARVETTWAGRRYPMRTNSLGFRDADAVAVSPERRGPRVVLIGDSMLEGLGVAFEQTAAGLLAAQGRARGVEVWNAASVSYSPKLDLLRIRWALDEQGVAFDRLVVFVDVSDVHDEVLYADFEPARGWSAWRSVAAAWQRRSLVAQLADALGGGAIDNRFRRDADVHAWMQTVEAYRRAEGNPDAGRWEWTYDDAAWRRFGERGLALAETPLGTLAALCRERGIELVVVVYPSPYQILARERGGRGETAWQRFGEREGVRVVDLYPLFADPARGEPEAVYERHFLPDDVHWNEAGHALVAAALAPAVLDGHAR